MKAGGTFSVNSLCTLGKASPGPIALGLLLKYDIFNKLHVNIAMARGQLASTKLVKNS